MGTTQPVVGVVTEKVGWRVPYNETRRLPRLLKVVVIRMDEEKFKSREKEKGSLNPKTHEKEITLTVVLR